MEETREKFLYFDEQGNAVGVGEETQIKEPADKPGAFVTQTIKAINGSFGSRKEVINDQLFEDIKDPSIEANLNDFKIDNISNQPEG